MIGVALTGERAWHASWWEWHGLIVTAYPVVGYAAQREWRDERFRGLYLPTTRERVQPVSVLFSDLAGFTAFSERATPAEVASVLNTYYDVAAPLISRFGGEMEKFMGDGIMATFNSRGDQPDHAVRAAGAALALQQRAGAVAEANPGWPRLRVGVNSGAASCARWAATGSSPTWSSATPSTRRRGSRRGAGGRRADRRGDPPALPDGARRGGAGPAGQGQGGGGRRVRPARGARLRVNPDGASRARTGDPEGAPRRPR